MEILLVEDHARQALVLKALFQEKGHQVTVIGLGLEACRLLQRYPFDLVVTDLWLPASPMLPTICPYGWDVARMAARVGLPVILHSGDEEAAERAGREGYRFVGKGNVHQLLDAVREVANAAAVYPRRAPSASGARRHRIYPS